MRTTLLRIIKKSLHQAVDAQQKEGNKISYQKEGLPTSPSRRKALKTMGLGIAGLSVSPTVFSGHPIIPPIPSPIRDHPSIAILGGGIAGLHCAWILKRRGIRATVYEASSRAGGRIFTLHNRFGEGLNTEAGGEFIDSNHTDMLGLAHHFNLPLLDFTTDPDHYEEAIFHFSSHKYGQNDLVEAFKPIVNLMMDHREKCGENYDTEFAVKLDHQSLEAYLGELPCDKWVVEMLTAAYVGEYGLDAGEQSSLNFLSLIGFPRDGVVPLFGESDERYMIMGGNQQIIYRLTEELDDQIEYGKAVRAIQKEGRGYSLHFEEGRSRQAEIMVCTIPFTVLRNIDLQIGEIDPVKVSCINDLGYGQNNKLLLGMGERIWRLGARPAQGYTYDSLVHTGWDNCHMQGGNRGKGGYTVFLGGNSSLELAANTHRDQGHFKLTDAHLDRYLARMEHIYAGFRNSFLGDHEVITWTGNPYSRASYSCYKVGQWSRLAGTETLPIHNDFLFAGEHCSADFQGFMNGGAETGRRAAERIVEMVGVRRR